jgi:hypothetical protein
MSKGSNPRPFEVPQEQFLSNWERTFGRKSKTESEPVPETKEPKRPKCDETK